MWSPLEGDFVVRDMAGITMTLKVTKVTEDRIYCGEPGVGWCFDRATGAEIDEELGWGPQFGVTGSKIIDILHLESGDGDAQAAS